MCLHLCLLVFFLLCSTDALQLSTNTNVTATELCLCPDLSPHNKQVKHGACYETIQ